MCVIVPNRNFSGGISLEEIKISHLYSFIQQILTEDPFYIRHYIKGWEYNDMNEGEKKNPGLQELTVEQGRQASWDKKQQ